MVSTKLKEKMDKILKDGNKAGWSKQQYRSELDKVVNEERALL